MGGYPFHLQPKSLTVTPHDHPNLYTEKGKCEGNIFYYLYQVVKNVLFDILIYCYYYFT